MIGIKIVAMRNKVCLALLLVANLALEINGDLTRTLLLGDLRINFLGSLGESKYGEAAKSASDMYYLLLDDYTIDSTIDEQVIVSMLELLETDMESNAQEFSSALTRHLFAYRNNYIYIINSWIRYSSSMGWLENSANFNPRSNEQVDFFFRYRLIEAMRAKNKDPGDLIRSFINGSGFCDIFGHPFELNDIIGMEEFGDEENIARFIFLIRTLSVRLVTYRSLFSGQKKIIALDQLHTICQNLASSTLSKNQRKDLMRNLLTGQLDSSDTYTVGVENDVCSKLLERLEDRSRLNFHLLVLSEDTKGLFFDECIDDLVEHWKSKYRTEEWQVYRASLINRWMDRIETFLKEKLGFVEVSKFAILVELLRDHYKRTSDILNTRVNYSFERYLLKVVEEVPAGDAREAYLGNGLCNLLDDENFKFVNSTVLAIAKRWSLADTPTFTSQENETGFVKFIYLMIVCQNLRERQAMKRKRIG